MKKIFTFVVSLFLAACASTGPAYSPPPSAASGYATLVLMRAPGMTGAASSHQYYVDGQSVAKLDTHGYTYVFVKAGVHDIKTGLPLGHDRDLMLDIDMKPGESYYLQDSLAVTGIVPTKHLVTVGFGFSFRVLSNEAVTQEISTYFYQPASLSKVD